MPSTSSIFTGWQRCPGNGSQICPGSTPSQRYSRLYFIMIRVPCAAGITRKRSGNSGRFSSRVRILEDLLNVLLVDVQTVDEVVELARRQAGVMGHQIAQPHSKEDVVLVVCREVTATHVVADVQTAVTEHQVIADTARDTTLAETPRIELRVPDRNETLPAHVVALERFDHMLDLCSFLQTFGIV